MQRERAQPGGVIPFFVGDRGGIGDELSDRALGGQDRFGRRGKKIDAGSKPTQSPFAAATRINTLAFGAVLRGSAFMGEKLQDAGFGGFGENVSHGFALADALDGWCGGKFILRAAGFWVKPREGGAQLAAEIRAEVVAILAQHWAAPPFLILLALDAPKLGSLGKKGRVCGPKKSDDVDVDWNPIGIRNSRVGGEHPSFGGFSQSAPRVGVGFEGQNGFGQGI